MPNPVGHRVGRPRYAGLKAVLLADYGARRRRARERNPGGYRQWRAQTGHEQNQYESPYQDGLRTKKRYSIEHDFPHRKKLRTRATNAAAAGELKCSGDMRLDETRVRSGNPAILQGQQPRGPEALRPRLATSLPLVRRLIGDADLRRRHRIASWI